MKAGWEARPLGQHIELISGQHIPAKDYNSDGRGMPYLTGPSDFGKHSPVIGKWTEHPKKKAVQGDVLLTVKGSGVGKINVLDIAAAAISRQIMAIRPAADVAPRYLHYFLSAQHRYFEQAAKGAAIPGLSREDVTSLPIPLPPIEEQQRIVAILDEAFEGLDRAKANAEANLASARELFERRLDEAMAELGKRNGYNKLTQFAEVKGGKRLPKGEKPQPEQTAHPYLSVRDFSDDGSIDRSKLGFISTEIHRQIARYTISKDDVYVSIAGTIGKTGIVPDELDGANLTENAAKLVLEEGWNKRYVYWCTRSSHFHDQVEASTRTAAQPKLALQRLGGIEVPLASSEEQEMAVQALDATFADCARLGSLQQEKLHSLVELRQSLLAKAFAGKLT